MFPQVKVIPPGLVETSLSFTFSLGSMFQPRMTLGQLGDFAFFVTDAEA
jgi:hypothetical protein